MSIGQQYRTPEQALATVDGIIVGRAVISPKDKTPAEAAREYQEAGWKAYLGRVSSLRPELAITEDRSLVRMPTL